MSVVRAGNTTSRLGLCRLSFLGVKRTWNTHRLGQSTAQCNQTVFAKQIYDPSENQYPLTKAEALSFITNTLQIPQEQIDLESNRMCLLNNIIRQMRHSVPLTNIPVITATKDGDTRLLPVLTKCKADILSCKGGQCYWINSFVRHLLSLIGFNIDFIGAGNRAKSLIYDFHQGVIVHDLSFPGSIHLAEAGNSSPIFEAISLNFEKSSPTYYHGKNVGKFFNCGRGIYKYCRLYLKDVSFLQPWEDFVEDSGEIWKLEYEYRTKDVKLLSHFTKMSEFLVSNPLLFPRAHQHFYILGYPRGLRVSIENYKLTVMEENGDYIVKPISTPQNLIETVLKYFPQFSTEIVEKAISIVFGNKCVT